MSQRKLRKVSVELNPIQMVWLHSQHLFQKIEQTCLQSQTSIKFFKNNNGVEIRMQGSEGNPYQLSRARDQLIRIINSNEIRLISTSLHKDIYIRISKETRKEFPKSYIIFLHYQTFENCTRKLQDKFNITSITPQLEKLLKSNPNFCFLIAEKEKINDIQKFTNRILHSEVSCASTTFSHKRQSLLTLSKRTMSASSLRGSFSDQNEQKYRLSVHPHTSQEQLFEMGEGIMAKLTITQIQQINLRRLYQGCKVSIEKYEGSYSSMTKKLYYVNRLQLTANPYLQPVYAYSMEERNPCLWVLTLVTDKKYHRLSNLLHDQWFLSIQNKIDTLIKIGKALTLLHQSLQTYSGLNIDNILLDDHHNVSLSAVIQKQVPPHTNAVIYDIRRYILLIYKVFTDAQLTYQMLVYKQQKQQYFCTLSHRSKNQLIRQFLDLTDRLFIRELDLKGFLDNCERLHKG